jgi:signal transduction histidine kinase
VTSSAFRWVDIIHPDDLEAARNAFQSFLADTSVPMTSYFRIRTAEGASRWIVARFREDPAHSDDLFGFLLDIHDRVVADEALRGAKEEAERASRARDELLTRLRDELKAPLDAILDAARLLEADDLAGPDREAVDRILSGGLHARALIDQDLDRSRIESVPRVDG